MRQTEETVRYSELTKYILQFIFTLFFLMSVPNLYCTDNLKNAVHNYKSSIHYKRFSFDKSPPLLVDSDELNQFLIDAKLEMKNGDYEFIELDDYRFLVKNFRSNKTYELPIIRSFIQSEILDGTIVFICDFYSKCSSGSWIGINGRKEEIRILENSADNYESTINFLNKLVEMDWFRITNSKELLDLFGVYLILRSKPEIVLTSVSDIECLIRNKCSKYGTKSVDRTLSKFNKLVKLPNVSESSPSLTITCFTHSKYKNDDKMHFNRWTIERKKKKITIRSEIVVKLDLSAGCGCFILE